MVIRITIFLFRKYIVNYLISIDHEYLVYQRNKYHNIPLWVIMNTLTFGQISKMFEFLPQNMQGAICQDVVCQIFV